MATRESINRIKIEHWRASRIPCNTAEDIYQGDLMCWDVTNKRATRLLAGSSGANFIGMSDTKNSMETAGSSTFLSATTTNRLNIVQSGLVEVIWGATETLFPFDEVVADTTPDAQTVRKGSTNPIGVVDPAVGTAGKAVTAGDLAKIWLQVRTNQYNLHR
jgi:hypothetical protein